MCLSCQQQQEHGKTLEELRIEVVRNGDAYDNILAFDQSVEEWFAGSKGRAKADSFLLKLFQDYRLPYELQKFEIETVIQDEIFLEIRNPAQNWDVLKLPALNYHANEVHFDVKAKIFYADYHKIINNIRLKKLQGRILITECLPDSFEKLIEICKETEILGLILITQNGNSTFCYQHKSRLNFPVIGISQEDGFYVKNIIEKYPEQHVWIKNSSMKIPSILQNYVISYVSNPTQPFVVMSSGWDSRYCSKSIIESVVSSMILADVARAFFRIQPKLPFNLKFVWLAAEEFDGIGREIFWEKSKKEGVNVRTWLDISGTCEFQNWYCWGKRIVNYDQKILQQLQVFDKKTQILTTHSKPLHQNFLPNIPFYFSQLSGSNPALHTDEDNTEWIHREMIVRTAAMLAISLYLFAQK